MPAPPEPPPPEPRRPVPAVGVACLRGPADALEVLLIRRSKPPRAGEWSLPGGRIEWGERAADAALRELREETGVEAELLGVVEVVDGMFPAPEGEPGDGFHYVLVDYAARWTAGEPQAGDDAAEARFHPISTVEGLGMWCETARIVRAVAARFGAGAA